MQVLAEGSETWETISNPAAIPDGRVKIREPYARVEVICNEEHVGSLMELGQSRRGELRDQRYIGLDRVKLVYSVPLSELVTDLHDAVKARSSGFASVSYEIEGGRESRLKRMDVLVAGVGVDGLSCVVHEDKAHAEGRVLVRKLKEVIPRQMFKVAIQAVTGGKVIASEHISAFRKGGLRCGFVLFCF